MNLRREYHLPNCTLVLEGLADDNLPEPNPQLMSILVNAEFHLGDTAEILCGGRLFLESFVHGASRYTQGFLSGLSHPASHPNDKIEVNFDPVPQHNAHRVWLRELEGESKLSKQVELTTSQLFDVVEAIDQFLNDPLTLPDFSVMLQPLTKHYVRPEEPLVVRSQPVVLGLGSLMLTAIALFFLPIPEINRPGGDNSTATNGENPVESANTPDGDPTEVDPIIEAAPEITDPTVLNFIMGHLYKTINENWQDRDRITGELAYGVSAGEDGALLNIQPLNERSADNQNLVPLKDLAFKPTARQQQNPEAIAKYKVVFDGPVLEISPWNGFSGTPGYGEQIRDQAQIQQLIGQVAPQLRAQWSGSDRTTENFEYRLGVTAEGVIADYEALNNAAAIQDPLVPFKTLVNPAAAGIVPGETVIPQKPMAQLKAILKPNGVVEVSPL